MSNIQCIEMKDEIEKFAYCLKIELETDGDYSCMYQHDNFKYDNERYTFIQGWDNEIAAISESKEILKEIKICTTSHRDYVQEAINNMFDKAIDNIGTSDDSNLSYMSGNYDGTQIEFIKVPIRKYLYWQTNSPVELLEKLKEHKLLRLPTFYEEYKSYIDVLNEQVFQPNGFKLRVTTN